jgi:hypothetical protein
LSFDGEPSGSWPTGVAAWVRRRGASVQWAWNLHHAPPPETRYPPEEDEPPEEWEPLEELEPLEEDDEPPEEREPPDLPKRASATVGVMQHPTASAAHSICLGVGTGDLLGRRVRSSKHFPLPPSLALPTADTCPTRRWPVHEHSRARVFATRRLAVLGSSVLSVGRGDSQVVRKRPALEAR